MRKLVLAGAAIALAVPATAGADAAYHTERLPLHGLAGATGGGMVVNVHANGPNVYAHEIYTLRHALPGTYQVTLHIFPAAAGCTGAPLLELPTAQLTTNGAGNARADVVFTPADADGLRGATYTIRWTLGSADATYATDCTTVTLD